MSDYLDLSICTDCLMIAANGGFDGECEHGDDLAHADAMAAEWPGFHLVPACGNDCEGWFAMTRCDGCGSTLGGERHPGAALS